MFEKKDEGSVMVEAVGTMIKIGVITMIIFNLAIFIIVYSKLNMVFEEVINRASLNGQISNVHITNCMDRYNLNNKKVTILDANPSVDEPCSYIGQEIYIKAGYEYRVLLPGKLSLYIPLMISKAGVNQGLYGNGYVKY